MSAMVMLYQKLYEEHQQKYGSQTAVFLMVGKFYELYSWIDSTTGEPSNSMKRAIEIMNIAIKEKKSYGPNGEPGLWGGIPEQSCHKFAQTLTREGWTVVIVDQIKDKTEQVIDRRPTRILSPGTHVEVATAERMAVGTLWLTDSLMAAAVMDLTTGEVFSHQSTKADDILHMFQVYCVREIIVCQEGVQQMDTPMIRSTFGLHGTVHQVAPPKPFDSEFTREELLRKFFRFKTLMPIRAVLGFASEPKPLIEKTLCVLLRFLEDHFPQQVERITRHEAFNPIHHMRLSNNILEQLNIITHNQQKSVLNLLEKTHTAIGKRALRERILRPTTNEVELIRRWDQVSWASGLSSQQRQSLERDLKGLYDLPRLHYKLSEGTLDTIDVIQLFQSYGSTKCLIQGVQDTPLSLSKDLQASILSHCELLEKLLDEDKARRRIEGEICGFLTAISGPETNKQEENIQKAQETWLTHWKQFCKLANIPFDSFRLEQKGTESEIEYVWEGSRTHTKAIEGAIFSLGKDKSPCLRGCGIEKKKSGPIQVTCGEFTTYTDSIRGFSAALQRALRVEVLAVCDTLWEDVMEFQTDWVEWLASIDITLALASVAKQYEWVRPCLGDSLSIQGLRHPILESAQTRARYVEHTVQLGGEKPGGWLIYGVNASGKSSLMKAVGISVILAQAGSFVPASSMTLRPYDAAFSRIWSHDNVWAGLSSFAVEISELRDILTNATSRSLVLGDEVCSGTESLSATALVASSLEHLDSLGAHFLFATHLHDLLKIPEFLPRPGIAVWHLQVLRTLDGKLIYDRTLKPGPGSNTYGLEVAKAMGIPLALLERAHAIRRHLGGEKTIEEAPKSSWNATIQRQVCENCNHPIVKELEVHHIVPRSEGGGNQLRNLVVLCETCHDKHHAKQLEIQPLVQTSEGLERIEATGAVAVAVASTPPAPITRSKLPTEQQEIIRNVVIRMKANKHPPKRILTELKAKEGIDITPAQLKPFLV